MTLTIIILAITNLITAGLLIFLRNRYKQLADYTRKADTERIALAIELGELKEEQEYIRFK